MKIAIIEDEPLELSQITNEIKSIRKKEVAGIGFEISAYQTIRDFEEKRQNVDLLVLDLHLPDGNGMDLARRLKEEHASTGVIIITAYQEHVYEGYEVGAFRFLPKPVDTEKLKEAKEAYSKELENI